MLALQYLFLQWGFLCPLEGAEGFLKFRISRLASFGCSAHQDVWGQISGGPVGLS
jgi:hypothetical protein